MQSTDVVENTRSRALSHKDYLETLHQPDEAEWRRITDIQRRKEIEINRPYHTTEEHNAATTIQKAFRGHRNRRQLEGLTLDPSSRWTELIKEYRFRSATTPRHKPISPVDLGDGRSRAASNAAKQHWQRVGQIAEHAVEGEARPSNLESDDYLSAKANLNETQQVGESMLMDMRYFLEMVDEKHRYGTNLQVYHEEWLRSKANENFFYWLDYGEGKYLDLPGCSRVKLDKENIRYLSRDERLNYLVVVDEEGLLRWHRNNELVTTSAESYKDSMHGIVPKDATNAPAFNDAEVARQREDDRQATRELARVLSPNRTSIFDISSESEDDGAHGGAQNSVSAADYSEKKEKRHHKGFHVSPATVLNHLLRASVKPGTWIYVADLRGRLYVGIKSSGAFQHASFLSGARISSAGLIGIKNGQLTYLSPLSGHYRPTTKSFRKFIDNLENQEVDMSHLRVSHAYEILVSMEYYGKTKKGVRKVLRRKKHEDVRKSPELDAKLHIAADNVSATSLVEQHWEQGHKKGLTKMMDEVHIARRSPGG